MIKQYLGIILSIVYALIIRVLGGMNVIEINSFAYFIVTPMVLGFIPFCFKGTGYRTSAAKAMLFPLISVFLFLVIAVMTSLEDLFCLIVIGLPYFGISLIVSSILYLITRNKTEGPGKKALSFLLFPVIFGMVEKQIPKRDTEQLISHSVVIGQPDSVVWENLFAVPDLRKNNHPGLMNAFGIPQPVRSTYDAKNNIRLGYFEKGIVLHESVVECETNRKLTFAIDIDRSVLESSPTLNHILKNKQVEFRYIRYELERLGEGKTLLKLSARYTIHSNIPLYGKFWSEVIIRDFEEKLLGSLKEVIE